jgi:hypothetical protein
MAVAATHSTLCNRLLGPSGAGKVKLHRERGEKLRPPLSSTQRHLERIS